MHLQDDAFGHWLAGFADGEGYFCISYRANPPGGSYMCSFRISLRSDDRPILEEIHQQTGLGRVGSAGLAPGSERYCQWTVTSQRDCAVLACLFERYPLRAKKARDFRVWKEAVAIWVRGNRNRWGDPSRWPRMKLLHQQLMAGRVFDADEWEPPPMIESNQLELEIA